MNGRSLFQRLIDALYADNVDLFENIINELPQAQVASIINQVTSDGNTLLIHTANMVEKNPRFTNGVKFVKILLAQPSIDVNVKNNGGYSALMRAAILNEVEIVRELLQKPELAINDTLKDGGTALSFCQKIEMVKLMLSARPMATYSSDREGIANVMRIAASEGDIELLKSLLANFSVDINAKSAIGDTALIAAAEGSQLKVIQFLLKQPKIDVNLTDDDGMSALMIAAIPEAEEALQISDQSGNVLMEVALNSKPPLPLKERMQMVKALLDAGADPSLKNNDGETAQTLATERQIQTLLHLERLESKEKAFRDRQVALMRAFRIQVEHAEQHLPAAGVTAPATEEQCEAQATLAHASQEIQKIAALTQKSVLDSLTLLLEMRPHLQEFSGLPAIITCFSQLMNVLIRDDEKMTAYARQLRKVAADMGDATAKRIEENFAGEEKPSQTRDASPARVAPPAAAAGLFGTPASDHHAKGDKQDRRSDRRGL